MSFMMLSFLMYSDGSIILMVGEYGHIKYERPSCRNNGWRIDIHGYLHINSISETIMLKDYVIFFSIIGAIIGLVLFAKFGLGV